MKRSLENEGRQYLTERIPAAMVEDAVFRLIWVNWQKNGGVVQTRLSLKPAGGIVPCRKILVNAIRKEVVDQENSASRVIDRGDTPYTRIFQMTPPRLARVLRMNPLTQGLPANSCSSEGEPKKDRGPSGVFLLSECM